MNLNKLYPDNVFSIYSNVCRIREKAYAPYSHFYVGAGLKFKHNDYVSYGCNVENSSYGATICAERNALVHLISQVGVGKLEFALIVGLDNIIPCALCLQVLMEFHTADTMVYLANPETIERSLLLKELLPFHFRLKK